MQGRTQFNFTQRWEESLAKPQEAAAKKKRLIWIASLVILLLAMVGSLPYLYSFKLAKDLRNIDQEIAYLEDIDKEVERINVLKAQIENNKLVLDQIQKNTREPVKILDTLKLYLPTGTIVNSFALNSDNTINLSLTVPTPIDVARLLVSLNSSKMFQSVDIQVVSMLDKSQTLSFALRLK